MRLNRTRRFLLLSAVLVGVPAIWHVTAHAANRSAVVLASDADDKYIKPLREDRTKLEAVKADLKSEASDPHGNRHQAIDAIDTAIKHISDEIEEYKTDDKK